MRKTQTFCNFVTPGISGDSGLSNFDDCIRNLARIACSESMQHSGDDGLLGEQDSVAEVWLRSVTS